MSYYQVTLNKGRTDTVTIEADSLVDVKSFFQAVSTANITCIKKIVYSKDLNIGHAVTTFTPNNQNVYLNVFCENEDNQNGVIDISYPIKNLTEKKIVESFKKNLLLNGKPITRVINILRK